MFFLCAKTREEDEDADEINVVLCLLLHIHKIKLQTNVECRNDLPVFFACCDGIFICFFFFR